MFTAATHTIDSLVKAHAEIRPAQPALAVNEGGKPGAWMSYGELDERSRDLANNLSALGINRGHVVGLLLPNGVDFCIALLAITRIGAVCMPIQAMSTAREVSYVLAHAGCQSAITTAEFRPLFAEAMQGGSVLVCLIEVQPRGGDKWKTDRFAAPNLTPPVLGTGTSGNKSPAILLYTSGSTARPKGIVLSHEAAIAAGQSNAWHQALRPEDRHGIVLPMYHCNAMFLQFFAALTVGASVYLSRQFDPEQYWREMGAAGVTVGNLVAAAIRKLLKQGAVSNRSGMRMMMYGMPLFKHELPEFESRFKCPLVMVYGLTETAACGTRSPIYLERRPDRIGVPMPGWEVRIVDDAGNDCPAESPGEIWIRGPAMFSGYLNDPQESARCLRDGGLLTGDIGYFDEHGFVVIIDRKKDLIKIKGRSVGSLEIETILYEHPEVREAAVVGVQDNNADERVIAFVVSSGKVTASELGTFCMQRLSRYKVPSEFVFCDTLPKTSVGKIRKAELKAEFAGRNSNGRPAQTP